jgi:hypothetical protein
MIKLPLFLFLGGFVFLVLSFDVTFTGAVIGTDIGISNKFFFIVSLIFFIMGLILLTKSTGLEYLVIPTGWEEPRIKKAKEELDRHYYDGIVITGHVNKGELKGSHRQFYYKELRKYGIKPNQMRVLDGIDSEEDILYLGNFVMPGDTLSFDTFPLHFHEYKLLIDKAIRDGKFPKGVKLKNLKINQGLKETIYGAAGWAEELTKRRKIDYKKNRPPEKYLTKAKEWVKSFLR